MLALVGTRDTKAREFDTLRAELERLGASVEFVDGTPDRAAGSSRAQALAKSAEGAAQRLAALERSGALGAVVGMGGSGNTELFFRATRDLAVGLPKLLLTTVTAGLSGLVGPPDAVIMHSVADISGSNSLLRFQIAQLARAAVALADGPRLPVRGPGERRAALTAMGLTTAAATVAESELTGLGWEVVTFHANGAGGRSLQRLLSEGYFDAVLDLTTTEVADEVVGGQRSAGPDRMAAASRSGVVQVVSVGGVDAVNFGSPDTVPPRFHARNLYRHGDAATLMRASADESEQIGRRIAADLSTATTAAAIVIPTRGFSALDAQGQPFHDPAADARLIGALRDALPSSIPCVEVDAHVNDTDFATRLARTLDRTYREFALEEATCTHERK